MLPIYHWNAGKYAHMQLECFFLRVAINVSILWVLIQPSGSFEPSYIKAIRLFLYSFIHGSHPSYDVSSLFPFMLRQIKDVDAILKWISLLSQLAGTVFHFRKKIMILCSLSLFLLSPPAWFNYLCVNVNYFGALPLKNGIITVKSCFL